MMQMIYSDAAGGFAASREYLAIRLQAHEHLLARIEEVGSEFSHWDEARVQKFVAREIDRFVQLRRVPINASEAQQIARDLLKEINGLGPLDDLMQDQDVEDILINGYQNVFISRRGVLQKQALAFSDDQHLLRIVQRVLAPLGRRLDESSPMVDARLPGGGRLNAVIPPLALDGPLVSIRKFRQEAWGMDDLVRMGSLDAAMSSLLHHAVRERCNILISGGTSSGKTSLLNAMAVFIPESERVVTIEDAAELSLHHPHVVRMESRPAGLDEQGTVSTRDLLRNSLRMRPDRIIVGEVRGAEVLEMLQAMNTGHDGSMATIHASSPRECLYRLEMLAGFAGFAGSELSLRRQMVSALDFIVQIGRLPNGKRRLLSITEVVGMVDDTVALQELYRHESQGGQVDSWHSLGVPPQTPKLAAWKAGNAAARGMANGGGWPL